MPALAHFNTLIFLRKTFISMTFYLLAFDAYSQESIPVLNLLFEPVPLLEGENPPAIFTDTPAGFNIQQADTETLPEEGLSTSSINSSEIEIEKFLTSLTDAEAELGPYSNEVQEGLINLGYLYQQAGDHEQALRMFQRALQIIKMNFGLDSQEQIPIIDAMMPSFNELGEYTDADGMQQLKLEIYQHSFGEQNILTVPALASFGDWHVQAFLDRSNILTSIDRVHNARAFLDDPSNYVEVPKGITDSPLFNIRLASTHYLTAIDILVRNKAFTHPDLLDLERKLISTYFLTTHRENIVYEPDFYLTLKKQKTGSRLDQRRTELMNSESYEMGQKSLKRSIIYIRNEENVDQRKLAMAMLEEADWDLLYGRLSWGTRKYREIYEHFEDNPQLLQQVTDILYPETPFIIPVYLPPPNSREKLSIPNDEEVGYLGYFDVSFSINRYGKSRKLKFLGSGGNVTKSMEIRLAQYIKKVQFRPRFENGRSYTDTMTLRYHIGY